MLGLQSMVIGKVQTKDIKHDSVVFTIVTKGELSPNWVYHNILSIACFIFLVF